jgi:hypothetical protein
MTKEECVQGFLWLYSMPWGSRYALDTLEGQTMLELLHTTFARVPAPVWWAGCWACAKGEKWPSVKELQTAMAAYQGPLALPLPSAVRDRVTTLDPARITHELV